MSISFMNINNTKNIGDNVCTPYHYYDFGGREKQLLDIDQHGADDQKGSVIYGGGAIASRAIRSSHRQSGKSFAWGIGSTRRGQESHAAINTDSFSLSGIRDYRGDGLYKADFVPCVSCKSEHFDKKYELKHELVFYGHRAVRPLDEMAEQWKAPYMDNEDGKSFGDVVKFLGEAETVVTSSYHGVYWAQLLGKRVICLPFGSKFFYFQYKPTYRNFEDSKAIHELIKNANHRLFPYVGLLEMYRDINDEFYERIMNEL